MEYLDTMQRTFTESFLLKEYSVYIYMYNIYIYMFYIYICVYLYNSVDTVDGSEILHHLGCIKPCK